MLLKFFFISILSSFILTHSCTSQCLLDQKSSLLLLKNELIFDTSISTKLVQWNQTNDCCKWHGVKCDGAGHVISLQLDGESISGGIGDSSTLSGLKYLAKLNLAYNNFNYTSIPRGIHNLTHLTHLNLSYAAFAGEVPAEISTMKTLVSLDLSSEYLSLNIETLLRNLTGLRELYLDGIHISSSNEGTKWSHIISSYLPNLTALSLRDCYVSGPLAKSFWQLRSLSILRLDNNDLSTVIPGLFAKFSSLSTLTLSHCSLVGSFPYRIFHIPTLQNLDLSFNEQLSGSIPPFNRNGSLKSINLTTTNFSGSIPSSISNHMNLTTIALSGCRFAGTIPSSFGNLSELMEVDLWGNFFTGSLSSIKFESLSNLVYLNFGGNLLTGNIPPSLFGLPSLKLLWLNDNRFTGQVDESPIVNFSTSTSSIVSLGLSSNLVEGPLPTFLCSAIHLDVLDLSVNKLSGSIPPCLHQNIRVLRLAHNNLTGRIPDSFPVLGCRLEYFDVSNNTLEGEIPKSLKNCKSLKYVNVRNNVINDAFPCMLPPTLHVLVLRFNRFHGEVRCHKSWPDLRVLDISSNNFSGSLESMNLSSSWTSMAQSRYDYFDYYTTGVVLVMKGKEMDLIKIDLDFGTLDFSCNNFSGEIPKVVGDLSLLHSLNLSHNALNGSIPNSFGKLEGLESLDLSRNQLRGTIPMELLELGFLSFLNLSYNKLVGEIPTDSFSVDSFRGNPQLCGFNLNISCTSYTDVDSGLSHTNGNEEEEEEEEEEKREIEWEYVFAPLGYVVGLGSFGWLLLLCPRIRHKYFGKIEEVVEEMFDARDRRRRRRNGRRVIVHRLRRQ